MRRTTWTVGICAIVIISAEGCSSGAAEDEQDTLSGSSPIIGGRPALDGEYPSEVAILTGGSFSCTATKVGPRHFLTAAHCVEDSNHRQVDAAFLPGATFPVTTALTVDASHPTASAVIQQTSIFPEWALDCAPGCSQKVTSPYPPDIALIVVDRDTPIPAAVVDVSPIQYGTAVVDVGYGCEQRNAPPAPFRLNVGNSRVMASGVQGPTGPVTWSPSQAAVYQFTEGTAINPQAASQCPGDSGGALFRPGSQRLYVGVMISSSLDDAGKLSTVDWVTRIDANARWAVPSWLTRLGVDVIHSVPSPSPFGGQPKTIPGTIQAEDFDLGDPEVAYHDSTPQNFPSSTYRVEAIDIDPCGDEGGGYNIGGVDVGEWVQYSTVASVSGAWVLQLRTASPSDNARLHVELDGRDVTGSIVPPNTHDNQKYQTVSIPNVRVDQGAHVVRVVFDTVGSNLNWLRFAAPTCSDGFQNQQESDVDCGGTCPQKCSDGKQCFVGSDCANGGCIGGICQRIPIDAGGSSDANADTGGRADAGMAKDANSGTGGSVDAGMAKDANGGTGGRAGAGGGTGGSSAAGAGGVGLGAGGATGGSGPARDAGASGGTGGSSVEPTGVGGSNETTTADSGRGAPVTPGNDPGCSCRVPGSHRSSGSAWFTGLLGAGLLVARRPARRRLGAR